MASSDLLKRLEALNGGPLANPVAERAAASVQVESLTGLLPRAHKTASSSNLFALFNVCEPEAETGHFEIVRPISAFVKGPDLISARVRSALERWAAEHTKVMFLDLETLGLKNEPLILIGVVEFGEDGALHCRQHFARELSEESSVIRAFAQQIGKGTLLVTFNGITFDEPFLRRRSAVHGIRVPRFGAHHDVLAASRMKLAGQVRDFRLKTLEYRICGRRRTGDVPGGEIPRAYSAYQRNGDATTIIRILEHNALDLITTADLFTRL